MPLFGRFKGVVQEGGNRNPPSWGFRGVLGGPLLPKSGPPNLQSPSRFHRLAFAKNLPPANFLHAAGPLWPQSSPPKNTALPLGQKIPIFPYNFLFLACNQSATSSFSHATGIQPGTTWRATDIQPSTTFQAPAAQNAFFPTMFHVQPGTTIFPSRKCQTLVGHCPARVCCILFHVEHRRNGISTKQSPRRHSRLGRRLKTRPRRVFLTPRRETPGR